MKRPEFPKNTIISEIDWGIKPTVAKILSTLGFGPRLQDKKSAERLEKWTKHNDNKNMRPNLPPLEQLSADDRGAIFRICQDADVLRIICLPSTYRAAHYHKTSSHFCLVTGYGELHYWERPVGSQEKPDFKIYKHGDLFYTGPLLEHLMFFPGQGSEFLCLSTGPRDRASYERDLVRLDVKLNEI